jgi:hypothetical protein
VGWKAIEYAAGIANNRARTVPPTEITMLFSAKVM